MEEAVNLFGSFDENIRLLETEFQVQVVNRGGEIVVSGEPENVMLAVKAVQALLTLSNKGESISDQHVRYVTGLVRSGQAERISELTQDVICITSKGRPVKPKTIGQKEYVNAIMKQTVTIGVGPAGTGKTYLAVAGFEPLASACAVCGREEPEAPMLDVLRGVVHCGGCKQPGGLSMPLTAAGLAALRHILYCDSRRLYAFTLEPAALRELDHAGEAFAASQLERSFRTLDYYKSLLG